MLHRRRQEKSAQRRRLRSCLPPRRWASSLITSARKMSTDDGIHSMHADVLDANPESADDRQRLVDELKERGNLAVKAKRWAESEALYSKAIEVGPTHALYSNRSMARLNLKKYELAVLDADECIALDGDFAKGYYRKACAHEKLKEYGPAYDAYKGCLSKTKKETARQKKEYAKMETASEDCYKKVCKQMRSGKVTVDTSAIERGASEVTVSAPGPSGFGDAEGARKDRAAKLDPSVTTEGDSEAGEMKGYKIVNGKKTSYFHNELTDEAKALLAVNAGPKKLDAAAVAAEAERVAAAGGGSAWNTAKTFEEKDMTKWSKDRLTAMVKNVDFEFEFEGMPGATLKFKKAKSVGGDASTPVIRGTKRYLFDLNIAVSWCDIKGLFRAPHWFTGLFGVFSLFRARFAQRDRQQDMHDDSFQFTVFREICG